MEVFAYINMYNIYYRTVSTENVIVVKIHINTFSV